MTETETIICGGKESADEIAFARLILNKDKHSSKVSKLLAQQIIDEITAQRCDAELGLLQHRAMPNIALLLANLMKQKANTDSTPQSAP